MKTKFISAIIVAAALATAAQAQSPAAVVASPPPDQIVYAAQLPPVASLTAVAAAQSLTIKQIVQTDRDITVTYLLTNGQTRTVSYQLLANVGQAPAVIAAKSIPAPEVYAAPTPVYVYTPVRDRYYYDDPYSYWYPPVAVSLGFGWGWGHGGHRH